jgi:HK97 family phage prohead protease
MDKTTNPQGLEHRVCRGLELRETEGDGVPDIVGYAAVYNEVADLGGGRLERIRPGAFTASLEAGENVYALVQHSREKPLGRRGAGTLTLTDDAKGLFVEIKPPNTQYARDAIESIGRGDIDGMSIGMDFQDAPIAIEDGKLVRSVNRAGLGDVSVATFAAYPGTTIALRSLERFDEQVALIRAGMPAKLARQKLDLLELTG